MSDHPKPGESGSPVEATKAAVTEPAADAVPEPVPEPDPDAVAITLNGRAVVARKGELVIAAAERLGAYIPRFCWHPRMSSVGMCRQCLVEIDSGRGAQLTPSCMVTVSPDMKIDTQSAITKRAQEGMLELLLANHPLDCPVCDKGGECPLQDQAFSHGPGRAATSRRSGTTRSRSRSATSSCSTASGASSATVARGSPTRSPVTRSSASPSGATRPR